MSFTQIRKPIRDVHEEIKQKDAFEPSEMTENHIVCNSAHVLEDSQLRLTPNNNDGNDDKSVPTSL